LNYGASGDEFDMGMRFKTYIGGTTIAENTVRKTSKQNWEYIYVFGREMTTSNPEATRIQNYLLDTIITGKLKRRKRIPADG
jgi:hypothetical protein